MAPEEPRQFFEDTAVKDGWSSPIAMAMHHIWKRDAKVKNLLDEVARLTRQWERLKARPEITPDMRDLLEALERRTLTTDAKMIALGLPDTEEQ